MSGRPGASWGWHPLVDEWAERVVQQAGVRPGDLVLDIGAGTGALTGPLLDAGAAVLAVELHPGRAAHLRARFAGADVRVLEIDARSLRLPRSRCLVVASPPYALTAPLLRLLMRPDSGLVGADLVLQRAVVHRQVRRPARPARWRASAGLSLPRSAFRPPPTVDSSVLRLRRR